MACFKNKPKEQEVNKNTYEILNLLISSLSKSNTVPPPLPEESTTNAKLKRLEYIKSNKWLNNDTLNICVKKELHKIKFNTLKKSKNYSSEFFTIKSNKDIKVNLLILNKHKLYTYNANEKNKDCDIKFSFSEVLFNIKLNEAIIIVSKNSGKLNGFSDIYYLKKIHNKWVVASKNNLFIS